MDLLVRILAILEPIRHDKKNYRSTYYISRQLGVTWGQANKVLVQAMHQGLVDYYEEDDDQYWHIDPLYSPQD